MQTICVVSLAAFERTLLDSIQSCLRPTDAITGAESSNICKRLFERWEWASTVRLALKESLSTENVTEYKADDLLLEKEICNRLAMSPEHGHRQFRTKNLKEENGSLFLEFRHLNSESVVVVPSPKDDKYWNVLKDMYQSTPVLMKSLTNLDMQAFQENPPLWPAGQIPGHDELFSIWKLVRMFDLGLSRPKNQILVSESLLKTDDFVSQYSSDIDGGYVKKADDRAGNNEDAQNNKPKTDGERSGDGLDRLIAALRAW